MKRKLVFGLLILALIALPLCAACGEEEITPTTPTTPTTPATTPATTEEPEVTELRFATHLPPVAGRMLAYQEWADKIAEASDGTVIVTIYPAGSLLSSDDMIEGVKLGLTDIGEITLGGDVDLFPLSNILGLPFMALGETQEAYSIWQTLQGEFPEMAAEYEDFKIVFSSGSGSDSFLLHTCDREVRLPADMKGIKVSSEGGMVTVMEDLDAAPVIAGAQEWYSNLQTGVLEGMWMNWMAVNEMGLLEFLKYHTIFPSGTIFGEMMMLMNWDSWNNLPPDVQEAIDDLRPWVEARIFELDGGADALGLANAQADAGHTIITLTPEEENLWYEAALPVHEEYLATYDAMGLPATEIYEEALRLAGQ